MAEIGIIIPTYNNLAELRTCLNLLKDQVYKECEVLVCVDGSTDGTIEWLSTQRFPCTLKVLHHQDFKNKGRLKTRELGISNSSAEKLIFLDSDLEIEMGWLQAHANALENYDISLGRVQFRNTENPWTDYYNSRGFNRIRESRIVPIRYFITGNVAIRRTIVDSFFLNIKNTTIYGEDLLLACSLFRNGITSCYYNANAIVGGVLTKTVQEARLQYIPFIHSILIPISKQYSACADFFNAKKVAQRAKKWHFLLSFFELNLSYWATCIDALPSSILTRWAIRVVLFLTMIKEFSKSDA